MPSKPARGCVAQAALTDWQTSRVLGLEGRSCEQSQVPLKPEACGCLFRPPVGGWVAGILDLHRLASHKIDLRNLV